MSELFPAAMLRALAGSNTLDASEEAAKAAFLPLRPLLRWRGDKPVKRVIPPSIIIYSTGCGAIPGRVNISVFCLPTRTSRETP